MTSSSYHEIVINTCYGGFPLSDAALHEYASRTSRAAHAYEAQRDDPVLVQLVKELAPDQDGADRARGGRVGRGSRVRIL